MSSASADFFIAPVYLSPGSDGPHSAGSQTNVCGVIVSALSASVVAIFIGASVRLGSLGAAAKGKRPRQFLVTPGGGTVSCSDEKGSGREGCGGCGVAL